MGGRPGDRRETRRPPLPNRHGSSRVIAAGRFHFTDCIPFIINHLREFPPPFFWSGTAVANRESIGLTNEKEQVNNKLEPDMCRVYSTILMIGTRDKSEALRELPLRLLVIDTAKEAVACLRNETVDSVVSQWDLVDMPQGRLLEKIIDARPGMPTVALIEPGNAEQEIAARSLGVTVILSENVDDAYFRSTICQILHIDNVSSLCLAGKARG